MDTLTYLKKLLEVYRKGGREESYYPVLKEFLESGGVEVLILPSKTSAGFPDLKVFQRDGFIVGYIEAKSPDENLEKFLETEQVKRYSKHFKNFILTNFLEFIHFLGGKEVGRAKILDFEDFQKGNFAKLKEEELKELLKDFLNFQEKPIKTSSELARELSWRVALLKDEIYKELKENSSLKSLYEQIRKYVIHNISEEEFADTIAQALSYALLILRVKKEFIKKEEVIFQIPRSLSIIRDIFVEILKIEGKEIEWIVDEIENTLNLFEPESEELTPEELTTHFYEPFLKEYNPKLREIRGVYYTPKPVVRFIVRSVEEILKKHFGFNGYVEESLKLLDPAGGTLTFILEVLSRVKERVENTYGEGASKEYFENTVLNNFFAFELLPAPYVIGHLKVGKFLSDLGIEDKRFKLYLTNALEFKHEGMPYLFSPQWAKEIKEADEIKTRERILVILGNPPYSGISANNRKEINEFLKKDVDGCQSYYKVDGKDIKSFLESLSRTQKVKVWLQDDYVKFIRFAQWKVERGKKGVVGYITNHSYIDNPTFAGMRQSLLKTFDKIYILDLHGNKRKREPDENVFDIQQGVAIGIFVKDGSKKGEYAEVYYYSTLEDEKLLKRQEKFNFLENNTVGSLKWHRVEPKSPFYFFKPVETVKKEEGSLSITEIFNKFVSGIVSARDGLVIGFSPQEVEEKIRFFIEENVSDEEVRERFFPKSRSSKYPAGDTRGWKLPQARKKLRKELKDRDITEFIKPILYRPFDVRYIFYHPLMVDWGRWDIMPHMLKGENWGLITHKREEIIGEWRHVFITKHITEHGSLSSKTTNYLFPLYLYTNSEKYPNFTREFKEYIKKLYHQEPAPEEILHYIYAVLYSPGYRQKYKEELKYNFPKIPFVSDYAKFKEISSIGEKLVKLHLLEDESLKIPSAKFEGKGENKVEKVSFKDGKIYINKTQYFSPVSKEVWEYKVGGYQVLKKWLSDRKGRKLNFEEIKTYLKIIKALEETLKLQKELDLLFSIRCP